MLTTIASAYGAAAYIAFLGPDLIDNALKIYLDRVDELSAWVSDILKRY